MDAAGVVLLHCVLLGGGLLVVTVNNTSLGWSRVPATARRRSIVN